MDRLRLALAPGRLAAALLLVLVHLAPTGTAAAQSGRRVTPSQNAPAGAVPNSVDDGGEVQLSTQEVLLSVTVRDAEGRSIKGLSPEDFIVAEDRVGQKIESFNPKREPVNVVLLLDASGSVLSELTSIRKAAAQFVDSLGPEDSVSVMQFADRVELIQDWTTDRTEVKHALDWRFKGGEATAFWDGLYLAAADQLAKVDGRRAIVLLSDGVDTRSRVTQTDAMAALDRSAASLYVISKASAIIEKIRPSAGKLGSILNGTGGAARDAIDILTVSEERMRTMADRYGGRLYAPLRDEDLAGVYAEIADELKQQYVISYVSTNDRRDGRWRSIEIYVRRPGLTVRTRKGYVAQ